MADKKHMDLLLQLEAAHLISVPAGISKRTMSLLKENRLTDKEMLKQALRSNEFAKIRGAGEVARQEACWWLIYGEETCPHCGK